MWPRKTLTAAQDVKLQTKNLFLRRAWYTDYEDWAQVRSRNRTFLEEYEPTWPKDCLSEAFFKRRVERLVDDARSDRAYTFLIFENTDLELIGGINLNNVVRGAAQYASLGYWLSEEWQGKGFMTQGARAVLGYAFTDLRLERVNAATLVHNKKSRAMLERLGFAEEGFAKSYIQIAGKRQDHILYGLNAEDFKEGFSGTA